MEILTNMGQQAALVLAIPAPVTLVEWHCLAVGEPWCHCHTVTSSEHGHTWQILADPAGIPEHGADISHYSLDNFSAFILT